MSDIERKALVVGCANKGHAIRTITTAEEFAEIFGYPMNETTRQAWRDLTGCGRTPALFELEEV